MDTLLAFWLAGWGAVVPYKIFSTRPGAGPSWYFGVCRDQPSGDAVVAWGLDATGQLQAGQSMGSPVATVTDPFGTDVTSTLLSGPVSLGPNAAGTANMVAVAALTNAVAGNTYRLRVEYVPSPPSPAGAKYELALDFLIIL